MRKLNQERIMIIRQLSLNKLFGVAALLLSWQALAQDQYCPKKFNVVERDAKSGYSFVPKELEKLHCTNSFEGENFKIVYATDDEAISFDHADKKLVQKAANVYYHLTVARHFWIDQIKSDYVSTMQPLTVRLDITNAYSSMRHFKNAEQEKNYNNAWSVPGGETPRAAGERKSWFREIWFSPMKKMESRKQVKTQGENPIHESLLLVKDPITDLNTNALVYLGMQWMKTPTINGSSIVDEAVKRVGAIAVLFAVLETTKYMDKYFVNKYFYIETAMVPEIIYHEYAHIAMSDTMKTVHSIPVIEGMADFFATRVAGRTKMYDELKGFANNRAKNAESKELYHPYLEGAWNATSDFTLSLLWAGKEAFDKANKQRLEKGQDPLVNYDDLVFTAHLELNEYSDIMHGLNGALVDACKVKCDSLRAGVNTLNYVFEKKGFN
jgi:hypothetical protein